MSRSRLALEAAIALTLFGCILVTVRALSANPFTIGIVRLVFASIVLVLLTKWRRTDAIWPRNRGDILRLVVIAFVFFGHWLTFFLSIKASSASIAAIGLSTYGIFLIVFGAIFARHPLRPIQVAAVTVAAAGAIVDVLGPRLELVRIIERQEKPGRSRGAAMRSPPPKA